MRYFTLFILILIFGNCKNNQRTHIAKSKASNLLDTIKNESRGARLLFFKDFATSKTSILIKTSKGQKDIDTLLSYIGNKKKDTACYLFSEQNPIGEIYFYKDTAMTEILADLYFTLDGKCHGWYGGIHRNSPKFDLTDEGKRFLSETKDRIEQSLKK